MHHVAIAFAAYYLVGVAYMAVMVIKHPRNDPWYDKAAAVMLISWLWPLGVLWGIADWIAEK
jgi:hypothetical protein